MRAIKLFLFAALVAVSFKISAQEPPVLEVDAKAIQQHIDQKTFPGYPLKAKSQHIQGTVVFDLFIGADGKIASMSIVSGPELLQQAATDCLKQWTFHPFLKDGVPVKAHGRYSIIYTLGENSETASKPPAQSTSHAQKNSVQTVIVHVKSETEIQTDDPILEENFHKTDNACKDGVLAKDSSQAIVASCVEAAMLAEKLPFEGNYVAKRSAFIYAATALANAHDLQEALPWAKKAVEVVQLGHDNESGANAAYSTKGTIEGLLGKLIDADSDMTTAEECSRRGILHAENGDTGSRSRYVEQLRKDLNFHAQFLQFIGHAEQAQQKLDEAAGLQ